MRDDADKAHRFILILKKDNKFFKYCYPGISSYYFYQHCVVGSEIELPPASMSKGLREVEIKGELK